MSPVEQNGLLIDMEMNPGNKSSAHSRTVRRAALAYIPVGENKSTGTAFHTLSFWHAVEGKACRRNNKPLPARNRFNFIRPRQPTAAKAFVGTPGALPLYPYRV